MRGRAHLILRGRVFHFRRAIPAAMRPLMRRRELSCGLHTSDPADAKHKALRLYLAADDLFLRVRTTPMLTDDQLSHLVQDYYSSVGPSLESASAGRFAGLPVGWLAKGTRRPSYRALRGGVDR